MPHNEAVSSFRFSKRTKGMKMDFLDIKDDRLSGATPLECAKKVEVRILRIFDRICAAHGLTYCIGYGTLIGAVRHGGFIPWDDDIDVNMPLEDYRKFIRVVKDDLPDDIGFYHGSETQCGFGKLIDLKSFYLDETIHNSMKAPSGIFIDIFPIRRYRSGWLHKKTTIFVRHGILHSQPFGRVTLINLLRKWFWQMVNSCIFYPLDWLNSSKNGKVAAVPQCMWGSSGILPEWPFPASNIKFEGFDFPAPRNADLYLRSIYGDYMKLPPQEKRFVHAKLIVPLIKSVDDEF